MRHAHILLLGMLALSDAWSATSPTPEPAASATPDWPFDNTRLLTSIDAAGWEFSYLTACGDGLDLTEVECKDFAGLIEFNNFFDNGDFKPFGQWAKKQHDGCGWHRALDAFGARWRDDRLYFNPPGRSIGGNEMSTMVCLKEQRSTAQEGAPAGAGPSSVTFEECTVELS